jgi:hypothetical protein
VDSDAEVAAARIGRVIGGRYRLERVLGIGGMAAVYQARDAAGQLHAVKLLHPEMAARREVRERFVREGSVSDRIGHPGVVQTFPAGDGTDDAYLVMEMLQGETLRARVKRHGRLPLEEVLDYADQVLDALVAAHDKGIVHRDLKPDNLFVTNEGRIKILDFGLARLLDGVPGENRTRTGVALGTLAYMAPEQALGRRAEIDGRVDVFALGATMFRILSGRRVHEAESEAELLMAMASRPAPPLASVAQGTPEPVCAVVDLSLAFSREARYPDARTMLGDVRALRAGAPPPYAVVRLASREEATRADGPAPSLRTQPLETAVPSQRGATVPLAAYRPSGAAGGATGPSLPPVDTAPMSTRGNTAPMAAGLGTTGAAFGATGAALPPGIQAAAVAATAMASTAPAVVASSKPGGSRGLVLAIGVLSLVLGLGGALWFLLPRSLPDVITERPLPLPEPSAESAAPAARPPAPAARADVPPPNAALPAALPDEPVAPAVTAATKPSPAPERPAIARSGATEKAAPAPASAPPPPTADAPAAPTPPAAAAPPPAAPPPAAAPAPAPAPAPGAPSPPPKKGGFKGKGKKTE